MGGWRGGGPLVISIFVLLFYSYFILFFGGSGGGGASLRGAHVFFIWPPGLWGREMRFSGFQVDIRAHCDVDPLPEDPSFISGSGHTLEFVHRTDGGNQGTQERINKRQ